MYKQSAESRLIDSKITKERTRRYSRQEVNTICVIFCGFGWSQIVLTTQIYAITITQMCEHYTTNHTSTDFETTNDQTLQND